MAQPSTAPVNGDYAVIAPGSVFVVRDEEWLVIGTSAVWEVDR